ncbi:MAG: DUF4388 domain-containing protein [Gemmatimonadota bacterium]
MAIRGSLSEASITDVLQLLAIGRKTGCLSVTNRSSLGRIYFDRGIISHASILNRRDRLGDLLLRNRVVQRAELEAAIAEQDRLDGARLGEILVRWGVASTGEIERYVRLQIEEGIYILFTWNEGSFHFEPGVAPAAGELLVAINPERVLLEGARRVDEWALIERKIPSHDLVFGLDRTHGDPEATDLSAEQRRILPLVDGRRSVSEIVEESGLLEFDAARALFGLIQAGFARHEGTKRAPRSNSDDGSPAGRRRLAHAFYRAGMLPEAERELHRLLESDPRDPDALFRSGIVHLRQDRPGAAIGPLMAVVEQELWPAAFQNLALALESEGRARDALLVVDAGLTHDRTAIPLLLSRAILLTRSGRAGEAVHAFETVDRAAPGGARPPSYYACSALALAAVGALGDARARAEAGLRLYPRAVPLLVNAAAIVERLGDEPEAERLLRRALEQEPSVRQALLRLAEILFRRGEFEEASSLLGRLTAAGGAGAEVHFMLGEIAYRFGDRRTALDHWQTTLSMDPEHEAARTNLELLEETRARDPM